MTAARIGKTSRLYGGQAPDTKTPSRTAPASARISPASGRSSCRNAACPRTLRERGFERGAALERAAQLDALGGGQQLDRDDVRGIVRHLEQAARRVRRHADVVLLVRRGRSAVDGRRVGQVLVLAGERRGRDLRQHEAGVEARLRGQEGRQLAQRGVGEQRDAALRERADLGQRERDLIGGKRHRLAVEIAARKDRAGFAGVAGANTSGLSETPFASRSSTRAAPSSSSRQAPMTCGWQRRL